MSEVCVYIYDISKGLCSQLSQALLGKYIPGIWHTGIVVFGKEFFFGSNGIDSCFPTTTLLGLPDKRVILGNTNRSIEDLDSFLINLSKNIFHGSKYDLLDHNCNTFSNELSIWLTGKGIPEYITNLSREILDTSFGQMLKPYLDKYTPAVTVRYKAVTSDGKLTFNSSNLNAVYYKESFESETKIVLSRTMFISQPQYVDIIKMMMTSVTEKCNSLVSEEIGDLLVFIEQIDSVDSATKYAIFDVLRLFILKDIEDVVSLFVNPLVWMYPVLHETSDIKLNDLKCRFFCNLVGKHFDIIFTNKEILTMVSKFGQLCLQCSSTIEAASSLMRNLVINLTNLGEELILEISSCLIHILANDEMIQSKATKENIVGSVYYLVKTSELAKDIARAQDIDKRIRRETEYCQLLHKELQ